MVEEDKIIEEIMKKEETNKNMKIVLDFLNSKKPFTTIPTESIIYNTLRNIAKTKFLPFACISRKNETYLINTSLTTVDNVVNFTAPESDKEKFKETATTQQPTTTVEIIDKIITMLNELKQQIKK